jgi:hypothetical protein
LKSSFSSNTIAVNVTEEATSKFILLKQEASVLHWLLARDFIVLYVFSHNEWRKNKLEREREREEKERERENRKSQYLIN